jgi:hypothetical protein
MYTNKGFDVASGILQKNINKATSKFKKAKAYQIHCFFKTYSNFPKDKHIIEKAKKFIGDFFVLAGLANEDEFVPNYLPSYDKVTHWINEGEALTPSHRKFQGN